MSSNPISKKPDLLQDYVLTDAADYVPYFMTTAYSPTVHVGIGEPKFISFGQKLCHTTSCGYKNAASQIASLRPTTRYFMYYSHYNRYTAEAPAIVHMTPYRGNVHLFMNSLFIMSEIMGSSDVLMMGVVKEEDVQRVKTIYVDNQETDATLLTLLTPYIEVWIADDFDVAKSQYPQARGMYRRSIRRILIENNLRIKIKPKVVMQNFLLKREVNFTTLDSLHTKINTLCQTAANARLSI